VEKWLNTSKTSNIKNAFDNKKKQRHRAGCENIKSIIEYQCKQFFNFANTFSFEIYMVSLNLQQYFKEQNAIVNLLIPLSQRVVCQQPCL